MQKNKISAVGGVETLPITHETRNQLEIADLKKLVLSEFGKWLRMDSQVPPIRRLRHPVAHALAAGQTEGLSFEAVQQFAISNSIWIDTEAEAAGKQLGEIAFLNLLATNLAEQARLLEKLLPVTGPN